jgi:hypothetical protein
MIRGMGFRPADTVQIGSVAATVTSILPTEITATVPAAGVGVSGSQNVTVNDLPSFNATAVIPAGISYDSATGDALTLVTAPAGAVPEDVPQAFAVIAMGADGNPAGGVTVLYSLTSGAASLECGNTICSVTTSGDGRAMLPVTATSTAATVVTAALTNGSSVQAHFSGSVPAVLTALTPTLYVAAGATVSWPVQALVLSGTAPLAGQQVGWQNASGIAAATTAAITDATGTASATLTVGPLSEGQSSASNACLNGTATCAAFSVFGSRPELASLVAVSGSSQSISASATPGGVVVRVLDGNGNPMAGGTVSISQTLYAWAPPCPRHGRCAQPQLLVKQLTTASSALDGTITITPLTMPGVATILQGLAATGNTGSLRFTIEEHP